MKEASFVKETSATTGTGTLSLDGAATGFRTFLAADQISTGDYVHYLVKSADGAEWERGAGVITSGTPDTLSRAFVFESSNAGSLVSFSAGTKEVAIAAGPEIAMGGHSSMVYLSSNQTITASGVDDVIWTGFYAADVSGFTLDGASEKLQGPVWADMVQFSALLEISGTAGDQFMVTMTLGNSTHGSPAALKYSGEILSGPGNKALINISSPPVARSFSGATITAKITVNNYGANSMNVVGGANYMIGTVLG